MLSNVYAILELRLLGLVYLMALLVAQMGAWHEDGLADWLSVVI
jgi:cobalamin synthase